jgi:hypothetical protein
LRVIMQQDQLFGEILIVGREAAGRRQEA